MNTMTDHVADTMTDHVADVINVNAKFLEVCKITGNVDDAKKLICDGADQFKFGLTLACINGYLPLVRVLVKYVPDVSYQLKMACSHSKVEIVRFLLEHGTAENKFLHVNGYPNWTHMHALLECINSKCLEAAQLIIQHYNANTCMSLLSVAEIASKNKYTQLTNCLLCYVFNQKLNDETRYTIVQRLSLIDHTESTKQIVKKYMGNYKSTNTEFAYTLLTFGIDHDNEFTRPLYTMRNKKIKLVNEALINTYAECNMFDINMLRIVDDYVPYEINYIDNAIKP